MNQKPKFTVVAECSDVYLVRPKELEDADISPKPYGSNTTPVWVLAYSRWGGRKNAIRVMKSVAKVLNDR